MSAAASRPGALGCIGAWSCALLAEEGARVVGYDLGTDDVGFGSRPAAQVPLEHGDIADRTRWSACSTGMRSRM